MSDDDNMFLRVSEYINQTMTKTGCPLSEDQKIVLAACLSVYMDYMHKQLIDKLVEQFKQL